MKVVALAGGTGSAKLLRGLSRLDVDLTVVANVGDNVWMYGLYICPDIDIACYTLAGIADRTKGWGIAGDTFEALSQLSLLGTETWFRVGDRDLATSVLRTQLLRAGSTLTEVTSRIRDSFGVGTELLPVTDDPVETRVITAKGDLHLQEFWVREKGRPRVSEVKYRGASRATITGATKAALKAADRIVLCPANPVTSIGPMLAIRGFARSLEESGARVVALSPMVGRSPYSGPAGKMMKAGGIRGDSVGVAGLYSRFLDSIVISEEDADMRREIAGLGIRCTASDTLMRDGTAEVRLARELLKA
ncbi:MAG: 2-phospho-L-lactate transferase [Thaumarchaeota archaeon]|nr:2-phospho-L-lactate transferase [Nitrososphaerota archaeon]